MKWSVLLLNAGLTALCFGAEAVLLAPSTSPDTVAAATAEKVDPAEVRRRIAALAAPDETVPYDERAVNWLSKRREQIVGQLIAALDDKNPKIAEQCLYILKSVTASKGLTDALIAKARDAKSPLRYEALRQLEKSAADPRVAQLLDHASAQTATFPNPLVRARWALLAGRRERSVAVLRPLLQKIANVEFEHVEAIRLLGEIREPASIELLLPIAAGDNWGLAVEAYKALAKIDPARHVVTKDQATLFSEGRTFKETNEQFRKRMNGLVRLNAKEVRPLVMQMLRDTGYAGRHAALLILTAWKDKEALPQIRALMQEKRSNDRRQAVAAYLTIDNRPQAQQDVLDLLVENDTYANEAVRAGIVTSEISADRKVVMLRATQIQGESPQAIPSALRFELNQGQDIGALLGPLMDKEPNLLALGSYCELAAADKGRRFGAQVRRVMERLSHEPTVSAGGEQATDEVAAAGRVILEAVATYDLKDLAVDVRKLMSSKNATIRAAAQATGAKLRIAGAMKDVYAQLNDRDTDRCCQAAKSLMSIPPTDEADRAAREEAVLSCLGKPSEPWAMRVLATCGGASTAKALEPILDDRDARRAVYAAWVLAQLPDKAAATNGLRRVAIFAMFHHQMYQQGAGIDFFIAPDLQFHQVTERLNPDPRAYAAGEGPVRIPTNLLTPFVWNEGEQQYAIRCFQLAQIAGNVHGQGVDIWMGPQSTALMDRTHLPLLREIAAQDSRLERLMVKGQVVAHFQNRQLAAKAIAAITKEKATYRGLASETLQSDAFPAPYQEQDGLLAKFFVDRVQRAQLPDQPQTDRQWQQFEVFRMMALHLRDQFGAPVLDAIREEARQQQVNMQHILPAKES